MGNFICPICNRKVDDKIIPYHKKVEEQIITVIKKMNPRWDDRKENKKIVDYYRSLLHNKTIR